MEGAQHTAREDEGGMWGEGIMASVFAPMTNRACSCYCNSMRILHRHTLSAYTIGIHHRHTLSLPTSFGVPGYLSEQSL
jgi:hypothetical protein